MDDTKALAGEASAPGGRFELRFRATIWDTQATLRQIRFTTVERLFGIIDAVASLLIGALLGLLVWGAMRAFYPEWSALRDFLACLCVATVFVWFRYVLSARRVRDYFEGQPMGMGETVIVADEDGLRETAAEITTSFKWPQVVALVETHDHLFFMFSRLAGVTVPKRVFASADQQEQFVTFTRSKIPSAV
jgi:hypothetical protein